MFGELVLGNEELPGDIKQPIVLTNPREYTCSTLGEVQDERYADEFMYHNAGYADDPWSVLIGENKLDGIGDYLGRVPTWVWIAMAYAGYVAYANRWLPKF